MNSAEAAKRAAARAAIDFVFPDRLLGVGSGSTVARFIDELGKAGVRPARAVSTSAGTDALLRGIGVEVVELESAASPIAVYVDGADEIDTRGRAIKGGGGAHTREKLVASASDTWVCIVDDTKIVSQLGHGAAVPVEMEKGYLECVLDTVLGWGAAPRIRVDWTANPLHALVDVGGLDLSDPGSMESKLEELPGVIACGIFAHRTADIVLVGHSDGSVSTLRPTDGQQNV